MAMLAGVLLFGLFCDGTDRRSAAVGWKDSFLLNGMQVGQQWTAWRFTPQHSAADGSDQTATRSHDRVVPTTTVTEGGDLVVGPLSLGYPDRDRCSLTFSGGRVMLNESSVAAAVGLWVTQPVAAPRPRVSCAGGFESSWPLVYRHRPTATDWLATE